MDTPINRPLPPARHRTRTARPIPEAHASSSPSSIDADQNAASEPFDNYAVGYKKPPKHSQFKPGRSGNPKGRPKAAKGLNTLIRETMTEQVMVRTASGEKKMQRMLAVIHKTIELAMKGNQRALSQLMALYASAVPESMPQEQAEVGGDLTATDLAVLDAFRASLTGEGGVQ